MTKTEQDKILENKIKANTFDFNLNRQSAIVSTFAEGNFDKYEYLTRIDLALKSNSLQKARFEHSAVGNLLGKKLKVSSDDEKDDDDDNILNQMRNHLNNLPKPVLQLPKQQSNFQTQTSLRSPPLLQSPPSPPPLLQSQQNGSSTHPKDFKLYYETKPYGVTTQ